MALWVPFGVFRHHLEPSKGQDGHPCTFLDGWRVHTDVLHVSPSVFGECRHLAMPIPHANLFWPCLAGTGHLPLRSWIKQQRADPEPSVHFSVYPRSIFHFWCPLESSQLAFQMQKWRWNSCRGLHTNTHTLLTPQDKQLEMHSEFLLYGVKCRPEVYCHP